MPTVEQLVEFIADKAKPFRNALYYSWAQWGHGKSQKPFDMTPQQAELWMENIFLGNPIPPFKSEGRAWDNAFGYARFLMDTYLVLTKERLGNFYEQYLRALMGAYRFCKKFPRYYPDNMPTVAEDNQDTLFAIRERMVQVWKLPVMEVNVQGLREKLNEQLTYDALAEYFLTNCPMMQNLLNARVSADDTVIERREISNHLEPTALLDYLRVLLEDVVAKNIAVNQTDRSEEQDSEYYSLSSQQREETWKSAFPDTDEENKNPMMQEFALDSRDLFPRAEKVRVTEAIYEAEGWLACRDEVVDGGNKTKKQRANVVELMIMSNGFPNITEEFLDYYTHQRHLVKRWSSFFTRAEVQKEIFSDQITNVEISRTNFEVLKSILKSADVPADSDAESEGYFSDTGVRVEVNWLPVFAIGGVLAALFLMQ